MKKKQILWTIMYGSKEEVGALQEAAQKKLSLFLKVFAALAGLEEIPKERTKKVFGVWKNTNTLKSKFVGALLARKSFSLEEMKQIISSELMDEEAFGLTFDQKLKDQPELQKLFDAALAELNATVEKVLRQSK